MGGLLHRLPARASTGASADRAATRGARSSPSRTIRAAAERLRGRRHPDAARPVRAAASDRRFLKAESLQPIGAFKLRGAYVADRLAVAGGAGRAASSPTRRATTPRASRGRRGCSGIPAVIVMPVRRPGRSSASASPADGAEIVIVGTASDERERVAESLAAERGLTHHPAVRRRPDHRRPGHDRPRARRGPAGPRRRPRPDRRRRAGQRRRDRRQGAAAGGPGHRRRAGARAPTPATRSRAARSSAGTADAGLADDRRRHAHAGARPRGRSRTCAPTSTAIVTVSEAEIAAAVRLAAERSRLVVEPSGALSIAAMAFHAAEVGLDGLDGSVVAVVSGGNVDPDRYRELPRGADPARAADRSAVGRARPRSSARRSARRRSRTRICGQLRVGLAVRPGASRASARIQPATSTRGSRR